MLFLSFKLLNTLHCHSVIIWPPETRNSRPKTKKTCHLPPGSPVPLTSRHHMFPHHVMPCNAWWINACSSTGCSYRSSTGCSCRSPTGCTRCHVNIHAANLLVFATSTRCGDLFSFANVKTTSPTPFPMICHWLNSEWIWQWRTSQREEKSHDTKP